MFSFDSERRLSELGASSEPHFDPQSGLPVIHGLRQVRDVLTRTPFLEEVPENADDVTQIVKNEFTQSLPGGDRTVIVYSLDTTTNQPKTVIVDRFSNHHRRAKDTVKQTVTVIDKKTGESRQVLPTSQTVYHQHFGPESTAHFVSRVTGVSGPFERKVFGPTVPVRRIGHPQIAA